MCTRPVPLSVVTKSPGTMRHDEWLRSATERCLELAGLVVETLVAIERRLVSQADRVGRRRLAASTQFASLSPCRQSTATKSTATITTFVCLVVVRASRIRVGCTGCDKLIARQSPRSRRPNEQRSVGRLCRRHRRAETSHTRLGSATCAVTLADFAGGERRAALGPPPDDFVALIKQAAVEEVF